MLLEAMWQDTSCVCNEDCGWQDDFSHSGNERLLTSSAFLFSISTSSSTSAAFRRRLYIHRDAHGFTGMQVKGARPSIFRKKGSTYPFLAARAQISAAFCAGFLFRNVLSPSLCWSCSSCVGRGGPSARTCQQHNRRTATATEAGSRMTGQCFVHV